MLKEINRESARKAVMVTDDRNMRVKAKAKKTPDRHWRAQNGSGKPDLVRIPGAIP